MMGDTVKDSQTSTIDSIPDPRPIGTAWPLFSQIENLPRAGLIAFVISVVVMVLYRELSQPEGGDPAIWDYFAQCILRGQVPYRDVIEIKTPGSAYLSAIAMWVGSWVGIRDVIAVRLMQMALVGLLSTATYLVAGEYLRSRTTALLAFMIPLTSAYYAGWMLAGTQPKLSMSL